MKKILALLLAATMVLGMTGCQQRNKTPNQYRGTDYPYDFVDFIDISVYGQNGLGYIEIRTKDFNMEDFNSERDYINVKRDLEAFNFNYSQGGRDPQYFTISKTEQISNGDVITITPRKSVETTSNMNFEAYDYVVQGLGDAEIINLFSSDLVTFYALNDGTYGVYVKNNQYYPQELRDHLVYTVTSKDKPVPGQAVLSVKVDLDAEYLKEIDCANLTIYLAKHNQRAAVETEKVLNELIEPIDITSANSAGIETALYKAIGDKDPDMIKICNLQQTERQRSAEPYTYTIVYEISKNGNHEFRRRDVKMIAIDGIYQVTDVASGQIVDAAFAENALDGANILLNYMIDKPIEEVPVEEPVETPIEDGESQETEASQEG